VAENELTFRGGEVEALQLMVIEWISAGIMRPPYSPEMERVIEKLRLPEEVLGAMREAGLDVAQDMPLRPNLG
jgi:hypothetical protein